MSHDPAYYRHQAERCRRLADGVLDKDSAARLIELAQRYEQQALAAQGRDGVPNAHVHDRPATRLSVRSR